MATLALNVDPQGAVTGARRAEGALDRVKRAGYGAEDGLGRVTGAANKAGLAMKGAALAAVASATAFAGRSIGAYREHNRALAEVSTLVGGASGEMEKLDQAAQDFAATFGGTATQQVGAFYQAISAGVGDVSDATAFLADANTLALAGVTDITTAVDVLTTATNAYSSVGLKAAEASDILFTGVKKGKTTVAELSSSLGLVIPIAASVGVGLDELVSGVAALTTQGQSTSVAVTGLRQTISSILKPTKEALDVAEALGIEFSAAALEAKGFGGFMEEVADKTGGSQEVLAKLFGSVEALNAVLALTGEAGIVFSDTMTDMATSTGIAAEAADQVSSSLSQRLSVQLGILHNVALDVGNAMLTVIVPALEMITTHADTALVALTGLGAAAAVFFPIVGGLTAVVGAAGLAFKALNENTEATTTLTEATDIQIQAEYDLEAALADVSGANAAAAQNAIVAANANIQAAQAAYTRAQAEYALADAIVGKQTVEASAARAADIPGNFFASDLIEMAEEDLQNAKQFQSETRKILEERAGAVKRAVVLMDKAITYGAGGPKLWDPKRNTPQTPQSDAGTNAADNIQSILDALNTGGSVGSGSGGAGGAVESLQDKFSDLLDAIDPTIRSTKDYEAAVQVLDQALASGLITSQAEYNDLLRAAQVEFGILGDKIDLVQSAADTMKSGFEDAFMSVFDNTKTAGEKFRDMAKNIISELYRILVVQQLVGSFDAATGTGNGLVGMIMGGLTGGLAGNRAGGGAVQAGMVYNVGERGPEKFFAPANGVIIPNKDLNSDAGTNVVVNMNLSANGDESVKQIMAKAAPKIAETIKSQIINDRRRGGQMRSAF